jgi:hypothetical protein
MNLTGLEIMKFEIQPETPRKELQNQSLISLLTIKATLMSNYEV